MGKTKQTANLVSNGFLTPDSDGIGIGTDNPDATLRVVESYLGSNVAAQANDIAVFERNDNGYIKVLSPNDKVGGIAFGDPNDSFIGAVRYDHDVNNLNFYVNNAERLRITSDGDVGIGTDNPGSILEVHSDTIPRINSVWQKSKHIGMSVGGSGGGFVITDGHFMTINHQPYSDRGTDNNLTERLRITSNGDVGIGTDNPSSRLQILDIDGTTTITGSRGSGHSYKFETTGLNAEGFNIIDVDNAQRAWLYYAGANPATDSYHTFNTNGTEILRITSNGDVGIGQDNPQSKLQIENAGEQLRLTYPSIASYIHEVKSNGDYAIDKDGTERLRISSDGELLIGGHTSGPSNQTPKIEAREDGTSNIWRALINSSNDTADKSAFLGIYGTKPGVFAHDRDMTAWDTLYLNTIDPLTTTNGGDVYTGGKFAIGTNNPNGYTFVCEKRDASGTTGTKNLVAKFVNAGQNTIEINMYGGSSDQVQFAATNQEQRISFCTGTNTSNVNQDTHTLYLTENRDIWGRGLGSSSYGGALFIGSGANPLSTLCALRDTNRRPMLYLGGNYPEITLAHEQASNASHGPTLRFCTYVQSTNTATGNQFVIGTNGTGTQLDIGHATAGQNVNVHNGINSYNGTHRFRVTTSGCQVNGSLSKSSGSFRIDHPLVGLSTTHDLVHSFLEGPQADLIYRGVVDLVDGTATVNIDTAGRMTEGTFEILCTNVSCFTSNETDWTAVKGSVSGNILTITAQDNTSTATVSWMVVGERKDQHMIDTDWTDENGRVITEPEKPPVEEITYSIDN